MDTMRATYCFFVSQSRSDHSIRLGGLGVLRNVSVFFASEGLFAWSSVSYWRLRASLRRK